ncbi:hypothetical protein HL653_06265 [Sphingomonas sp. AP4-R1]|uniref:hypothetical protein n=1 Tax=Sphingomonas sp. AP4-R1 TaxID=2735134 RepID=UPI0014932D1C|nr:hypothetical protein [Sphingomonas sp. AP4-R1]QJU57448.1 hypothetical protein HL653_06265 [Sphingomonas sp. AP4-R1]
MSRSQQPDRVRILSSRRPAVDFGRRRADPSPDGAEEDVAADIVELVAAAPAAPAAVTRLPLRLVGLFLCSSALGGACAVASGLFGIAGR